MRSEWVGQSGEIRVARSKWAGQNGEVRVGESEWRGRSGQITQKYHNAEPAVSASNM